MNTIEFAIKDGVPYAIDFLNPAPDFERDRITQHYFELVLEPMRGSSIDRAVSGALTSRWPRWEQMTGMAKGAASSASRAPRVASLSSEEPMRVSTLTDAIDCWHGLLSPDVELTAVWRTVRRGLA